MKLQKSYLGSRVPVTFLVALELVALVEPMRLVALLVALLVTV